MKEGINWRPKNAAEFVAAVTFFGAGLVGLGIALGCYRTTQFFQRIRGTKYGQN